MRRIWQGMVLAAGVILGLSHSASAGEYIADGNFGSLDGWKVLQEGVKAAEPNSVFSLAYPDNGKSALLPGESSDPSRELYLTQSFGEVSGKILWQFDFRLPSDGELDQAGWVVILGHAGQPACYTFISRRQIGVLGLDASGKSQRLTGVNLESWYHFEAEIDLAERNISWKLVSEGGEEHVFESVRVEERFSRGGVDSVTIRKNVGPQVQSSGSLLIDNVSVREGK